MCTTVNSFIYDVMFLLFERIHCAMMQEPICDCFRYKRMYVIDGERKEVSVIISYYHELPDNRTTVRTSVLGLLEGSCRSLFGSCMI